MSRQENDRERKPADRDQREVDSEELSERISEALEPTLSDVSLRVAEAVTQSLSNQQRDALDEPAAESAQTTDEEPTPAEDEPAAESVQTPVDESSEEPAPPDVERSDTSAEESETSSEDHPLLNKAAGALASALPTSSSSEATAESDSSSDQTPESDSSSDRSMLGAASSSLVSSFVESMRDEGGDQLDSLVDQGVDMLFSRRGKGWVRNLADRTLQASLYDTLGSIDDPNERNQLYRENLGKLRPIVRQAVDAMFTDEARNTLKRELRGAIPSLLHGDFNTAFSMLVEALSDVTDYAEEVFWDHSQELLTVFQQISTTLLQESVEDAFEEKVNPDDIRERVQGKAEEARDKLQSVAGRFQEAGQEVQSRIGEKTGGMRGTGTPGMPPSGTPPSGMPPSGMPPSGRPPSGMPPNGRPPSGRHPAAERRQQQSAAQNGRRRTRRTPEV